MELIKLLYIAVSLVSLTLVSLPPITPQSYACDQRNPETTNFLFCDTSLSYEDRVNDLVSRLTLKEKVQQLGSGSTGVSRLGIPAYEWWSEANHGIFSSRYAAKFNGSMPRATTFPAVILTGASFNEKLWLKMGKVVSDEGRAMYNVGQAGLTYWAPTVNVFRDPRWGRGQESPGEDPLMVSRYGVKYVNGLQDVGDERVSGSNSRLKVSACCKHYSAYDLEYWGGVDRYHFDAMVTKQDMEDTYQPPFRSCVKEGHASCVMCSYNRVNGVPSCFDSQLLQGVVRNQWNLNGYIVTDCQALQTYLKCNYTPTPEDAVALALKAGVTMECSIVMQNYTENAIHLNKTDESIVNQALTYNYIVLMRLGFFDGNPKSLQFGSLGPSDVCADDHQQLAIDAARQGIVLLENKGALPLSNDKTSNLAVIGPNGNATFTLLSVYAGMPCNITTPLQGLQKYVSAVTYEAGCDSASCPNQTRIAAAVEVAAAADVVVLIMGLDETMEGEWIDRDNLTFPGYQEQLINSVVAATNGVVVLVIMSGGPIDIAFAKNDNRIGAILWVGYPGQGGGDAIAQVLFGDYNPAGRSPFTWYPKEYTEQVPMSNMNMRANTFPNFPGRTYRFYTGNPVYDFGHGLSYSTFTKSIISAPSGFLVQLNSPTSRNHSGEAIDVSAVRNCNELNMKLVVEVSNTGSMTGDHVVLIFWRPPSSTEVNGEPNKELVGFKRVKVKQGEKRNVSFGIKLCKRMSVADRAGTRKLVTGKHVITVGSSSEQQIKHTTDLRVSANAMQ
ncbi:unnamed protein product [Linum trigynum]|uniref:Fibronectin type III-like domain-containing protein n=1 Tax=Linum trigynum TaxID=586398 RepID=A0AAV2CCB6_9ROSI